MNDYKLDHICSYTGRLASPPEVLGPVPEGIRVNFYTTGGEITGPRLRGKLRPVGGDWVTIRTDGVAYLDVRSTFETDDGALILVTYQGVLDFGEDGYDRFLRGEMPPVVKLRTSPRFVTSHADYLWLNRLFCVGIGEYRAAEEAAKYDVYAVRQSRGCKAMDPHEVRKPPENGNGTMIHSAIPVIAIADSSRAEAYYCQVLGFQKMFAYRPDPAKNDPCYLGVARDGVWLHLHSFKPDRAGLTEVFLYVADVDRLHAEICARGAVCQLPPTDQTWGNRETHIRDPDGNVLCFAKAQDERKA